MASKAILSSKGQLVIPKPLRNQMGLHLGSELTLELTSKNSLVLSTVTQSISRFFGAGKTKIKQRKMSIEDIDKAISEAILEFV